MNFADQASFDVRFDWALAGLDHLLSGAAQVVIVDILSFSTAVEAAVSRGARVYPYDRRGPEATAYAESLGALSAVPRGERRGSHTFSLSPISLTALNEGDRLVLPSPNGATLAFRAAEQPITIIAGSLRNARAVAEFCLSHGGPTAVIAAGEKWGGYQGPIRPAVEDLIGAGAIIDHLAALNLSPEAESARGAFLQVRERLSETLRRSASGRELIEAGFEHDVLFSAELNISDVVPIMEERCFRGV